MQDVRLLVIRGVQVLIALVAVWVAIRHVRRALSPDSTDIDDLLRRQRQERSTNPNRTHIHHG
jgi:hypothetical protein